VWASHTARSSPEHAMSPTQTKSNQDKRGSKKATWIQPRQRRCNACLACDRPLRAPPPIFPQSFPQLQRGPRNNLVPSHHRLPSRDTPRCPPPLNFSNAGMSLYNNKITHRSFWATFPMHVGNRMRQTNMQIALLHEGLCTCAWRREPGLIGARGYFVAEGTFAERGTAERLRCVGTEDSL
jgi:hypothetical protein